MNGATAEPWLKMTKPPNITIIRTMGNNQNFLRTLRNNQSSAIKLNLHSTTGCAWPRARGPAARRTSNNYSNPRRNQAPSDFFPLPA